MGLQLVMVLALFLELMAGEFKNLILQFEHYKSKLKVKRKKELEVKCRTR